MLKSFFVLLRFFAFWLVFFFIDRLIFILYFFNKLKGAKPSEVIESFVYGLWMDTSMAGYVSVLPLLLFLCVWTIPGFTVSKKIFERFTKTLIVLFSFISIVNFNIYREWGSKINFRALDFAINSPNEALASSASSPILSSLLIFFFLTGINFILQKKIISYQLPPRIGYLRSVAAGLLFMAFNFLAIRGGWNLSPMNESMAYYSHTPFLNHATINTEWTLFKDILNNKYGTKNPYNYLKPAEAAAMVKTMYPVTVASAPEILTSKRPNIVLIIMESFTAGLVKSLEGESGITPQFEKLAGNGILFSNIYAAGDRTDKGLVAVISAFPSQAVRSIIHFNGKQEKLPSISQELHKAGYTNSFYYGGESEFFNFKAYIISHSYQKLVDKKEFNKKDMNSKWGAYDHVVYNRQLNDLSGQKQPFFSTILTLTNHEPFELPVKPHFPGQSLEDKFRSTAYYADSCLADYLHKAEKQPWFKNTLFIVVADHGHRLPESKYEIYEPQRFHIPVLFYGGALKPEYRGYRMTRTGSQLDIASTLLHQLHLSSSSFSWSKDLFNPQSKEFAFYTWDNGFGFATPRQTISFDNVGRKVTFSKGNDNSPADSALTVKTGQAFMQQVFQQYLDY